MGEGETGHTMTSQRGPSFMLSLSYHRLLEVSAVSRTIRDSVQISTIRDFKFDFFTIIRNISGGYFSFENEQRFSDFEPDFFIIIRKVCCINDQTKFCYYAIKPSGLVPDISGGYCMA
ncbi:hypothetical protein CDAR_255331 [Caerostris darwini]|uniref:Uncharacterized protein n=1 Tax=Caerostris darwini TaxID=1538125 RepID=A0AAV4V1W8_9ARAC|nr:hypothetical protein CDAR_255331 [Caerostris darwini]